MITQFSLEMKTITQAALDGPADLRSQRLGFTRNKKGERLKKKLTKGSYDGMVEPLEIKIPQSNAPGRHNLNFQHP